MEPEAKKERRIPKADLREDRNTLDFKKAEDPKIGNTSKSVNNDNSSPRRATFY